MQVEGTKSDQMAVTQSMCDCLESWFGSKQNAGRRHTQGGLGSKGWGPKPSEVVASGETCLGQAVT